MKFMAFWGVGYAQYSPDRDCPRLSVSLDFFCDERGYSESDRRAISALEVGESLGLNDSGYHSVVRFA